MSGSSFAICFLFGFALYFLFDIFRARIEISVMDTMVKKFMADAAARASAPLTHHTLKADIESVVMGVLQRERRNGGILSGLKSGACEKD